MLGVACGGGLKLLSVGYRIWFSDTATALTARRVRHGVESLPARSSPHLYGVLVLRCLFNSSVNHPSPLPFPLLHGRRAPGLSGLHLSLPGPPCSAQKDTLRPVRKMPVATAGFHPLAPSATSSRRPSRQWACPRQ